LLFIDFNDILDGLLNVAIFSGLGLEFFYGDRGNELLISGDWV
jgi:hypothetical protein